MLGGGGPAMVGELLTGTEEESEVVGSVDIVPIDVEIVGVCSIRVTPLDGLSEALRTIPARSTETTVSRILAVQDEGSTLH